MTEPVRTSLATADYLAVLRAYVSRHMRNDEIDDVLQETALRLHQRQSQDDIDNPRAYAFRVARSVMADRRRRNAVRRRDAHIKLDEADHPVELVTPERIFAGKEAVARFAAALEEMPSRTREVFVLHRFEDMSYAEIADHIGLSLSAVGKHMVKALRFLAQKELP